MENLKIAKLAVDVTSTGLSTWFEVFLIHKKDSENLNRQNRKPFYWSEPTS